MYFPNLTFLLTVARSHGCPYRKHTESTRIFHREYSFAGFKNTGRQTYKNVILWLLHVRRRIEKRKYPLELDETVHRQVFVLAPASHGLTGLQASFEAQVICANKQARGRGD